MASVPAQSPKQASEGEPAPVVAVVMGSDSDWSVMSDAAETLTAFGIPHEVEVVSAHRTPQRMIAFGSEAAGRGIRVIIAGAGGAAHLPGMLASVTTLPVIGVPVPLAQLDGLDSLLSIVQMPAGIPVATVVDRRGAQRRTARRPHPVDDGCRARARRSPSTPRDSSAWSSRRTSRCRRR